MPLCTQMAWSHSSLRHESLTRWLELYVSLIIIIVMIMNHSSYQPSVHKHGPRAKGTAEATRFGPCRSLISNLPSMLGLPEVDCSVPSCSAGLRLPVVDRHSSQTTSATRSGALKMDQPCSSTPPPSFLGFACRPAGQGDGIWCLFASLGPAQLLGYWTTNWTNVRGAEDEDSRRMNCTPSHLVFRIENLQRSIRRS